MLTYSVLNPVRATPIFGGLGQNVLPSSVHSNMQLVKPDNERRYCRERKVEKVTNLTLQWVLQFCVFVFFFSCLSSHSVVIIRVKRHSKNLPCSWNTVASATKIVLKGDDERWGTCQLSLVWHGMAKSQAYCFPQCRSSTCWQAVTEDYPKWLVGVVTQLLCGHSQWLE